MNLFHYARKGRLLTEEKLSKRRERVLKMDFSELSHSELDTRVEEKLSAITKQIPKDERKKSGYLMWKSIWSHMKTLVWRRNVK